VVYAADKNQSSEAQTSRPKFRGLSTDQLKKLLYLIDVPKIGCEKLKGTGDWLLDNGVTYHIIGDLNKLSKVN